MDNEKNISLRQLAAKLKYSKEVQLVYSDDDLVVVDNIKHTDDGVNFLPKDILYMVACKKGYVDINLRGKRMRLSMGEVLLMRTGSIVQHVVSSEDFESVGLGMSVGILQQAFHRGKDIHAILFKLLERPIITIGEEGIELFGYYRDLLETKLQHRERRFTKQTIACLICALLYELFAEVDIDTNIEATEAPPLLRDKLFKDFILLISNSEVIERRLQYYADKLCVTPKYLSSVCKSVSGKTGVQWINEMLADSIRHQLEFSELTIKEIANKFDFPNLSFFGKFVKKHLGASPNEYRKQKMHHWTGNDE